MIQHDAEDEGKGPLPHALAAVSYTHLSGVVFIPAHLAEYVAIRAEKTYLRDSFSFERLESGTYTSAQVDQAWWPEFMMTDFMDWFHHSAKAENYQYLDWSEEMEDSKKPPRQKQFDGIVCYSYHLSLIHI